MMANRLTWILGALAVLAAPAVPAAAAISGKAPDHVDDLACYLHLDYYAFALEKDIKSGKYDGEERDQVIGYLGHWQSARGFFQGRLASQPPVDFDKAAKAARERMAAAPKKELADTVLDCLLYFDAQDSKIAKIVYGANEKN